MSRNRVTPKGNFLPFPYDHISGRLSDSSFRQDCGKRIWWFQTGNDQNNPQRRTRNGVVAFLKTHLPPGDRALPSKGAWCPWLGQERRRLTKTSRTYELHYLLPHDSSHNDVTVSKNHSRRAGTVNVNG